jgi:hypothetical protein
MYVTAPIGYGNVFLNDILMANINAAGQSLGFSIERDLPPKAMLIPVAGLCVGLLFALLVTYKQPKTYQDRPIQGNDDQERPVDLKRWQLAGIGIALVASLAVQLWSGSMVLGGLAGFALLSACGFIDWNEQDNVFTQGIRLMAFVGFIMIAASGFAAVMKATGEIPLLVQYASGLIGGSKSLAAIMMLLVGLLVTDGDRFVIFDSADYRCNICSSVYQFRFLANGHHRFDRDCCSTGRCRFTCLRFYTGTDGRPECGWPA